MKKGIKLQSVSIYIALIVVVFLFSVSSDTFLTVPNVINIFRQVSTLGIMAIGATFVMITGGVDLSVGAQVSIIGITISHLMVNMQVHPVLSVILGILVGVLIGLCNGLIVTKINIPPMIATLGMMQIVKGMSYFICSGLPIYGFPDGFSVIGQKSIGIIPISVMIFVACIIVGWFILNMTSFGRYIYAVGSNEEATRLSGIATKKIKLSVYVIGSLFTAVAALITLSRINAGQAISGIGTEFDVLTAVILGGVAFTGGAGRISGVIAGILIIGVLSNGLVMVGIGEYVQIMIKGFVLLFALSTTTLTDYISAQRAKKRTA